MIRENNKASSDNRRQAIDNQPILQSANKDDHIFRILTILNENISRSNSLHHEFLKGQSLTIHTMSPEIRLREVPSQSKTIQKPFISKAQLREFGTGSIAKCFGPDFAILDQRRSPRIPNGDLLMIDRIISIVGERKVLRPPASIVSEFDVPGNAWFLQENKYSGLPLSILMEIALQPCGILSAYLGTSLELPVENNRFRNLDGEITFRDCPDLSGRTITNYAAFLKSFSSGGMHIQEYTFELSVDASVFLAGESSFGYFSQEAMEQQTGLGYQENPNHAMEARTVKTHQDQNREGAVTLQTNSLQSKHLYLVDSARFYENTGRYSKGVIRGEKLLRGDEWFYNNHFFQDPVMPGSLGLESVMQGLWAFVRHQRYDVKFSNPVLDFTGNDPFVWKYRGQVIPSNHLINYQIHLKEVQVFDSTIFISADADFQVDGTRIYAFKNIAFAIREG
jgi:3-hydroxymyristoyl/3-hydroxydecanoyl-(acyl carrier protein) dehydratase